MADKANMPNMKVIPLPFPSRGVHEASAVAEQPEGTSPQAQNGRGFDLVARRDRGCQRVGFSRLPNVINTGGPIDIIRSAMLGQISASFGGLAYTYSAATMIAAGNGDHTVGTPVTYNQYYSSAYQKFKVSSSKTAMPSSGTALFTPGYAGMAAGTITFQATINYQGGVCTFQSTFSTGSGVYYITVQLNNGNILLSMFSSHGTVTNTFAITALSTGAQVFHTEISPTGIVCKVAGVTILTHTYTSAEQTAADDIFGTGFATAIYGTAILAINATTATPGSNLYDLISISATAAANADPLSEVVCYLQTDANTLIGSINVGTVLGGFLNTVSGSGGGSIYSRASQIDVCPAYGNFYLVDGVNGMKKITPGAAVTTPTPTAGTIPALSRILALYHGRLFHGGILTDPFNYFASRSGDVLDYDYGQLDSAGAFAGNATPQAGLLADYLTAMIPFGDMSMIMGMGSSIAVMRGDPKSGGDLAMLSREVGIASIGAWCRTPDNDVFFMARDGLYRIAGAALARGNMPPPPVPVSRGRLDRTLGRIDFTQTRVFMCWDPLELGVKIVLSPTDATQPTTIVFLDERHDAFWIDTVPTALAPRAVCPLRGSGGPGGAMLYGGYDGWVRYMNPAAFTDDGNAIASRVRYTPLMPFGNEVRAKLTGTRHLWGDEGVPFNAQYAIYTGDDPISALAADADQTVQVAEGGYQPINNARSRGACIVMEISNSTLGKTWQIEQTTLHVEPSGRVRA